MYLFIEFADKPCTYLKKKVRFNYEVFDFVYVILFIIHIIMSQKNTAM